MIYMILSINTLRSKYFRRKAADIDGWMALIILGAQVLIDSGKALTTFDGFD